MRELGNEGWLMGSKDIGEVRKKEGRGFGEKRV